MAIVILCARFSTAAQTIFRNPKFEGNYDGDTITVSIDNLPSVFGEKISIRIKGVVTAEIKGKCPFEKELAQKAKRFINDLLDYCDRTGVRTIIFEKADRFARDLVVQELGYQDLKNAGFRLIPADTPNYFEEDNPSLKMVRQILGAVAEYQKDDLIAKLKGARDRKKKANKDSKANLTLGGDGKCEGRKSYAEINPDLIKLARKLYRKPRYGKRLSLRKVSSKLFEMGHGTSSDKPYSASQIKKFIV